MNLKTKHGMLECNNCKRYGKKEVTGEDWCYLKMEPTKPHLYCKYHVKNVIKINSLKYNPIPVDKFLKQEEKK